VKGGQKKSTYGDVFMVGGLDCACAAGHVKTGAADNTRWAKIDDGRVIILPCCGTKGVNRCDQPKMPTNPAQLPEMLRGNWQIDMPVSGWTNWVKLSTLKMQRSAERKAAAV
jgi:hypothetical protein